MLPSPRTYGFWLALVRIYTGFFWLDHGVGKLRAQPPFGAPGGQMAQFIAAQTAHAHGAYAQFLTTVVQPNLSSFAYAVMLGEMTAGALLIAGLFTRFGALIGVVLAVNYWLAKGGFDAVSAASTGVHGLAASAGFEMCAAVLTAISLVLPTGRVFGIDGLWPKRPPVRRAAPRPVQAGP